MIRLQSKTMVLMILTVVFGTFSIFSYIPQAKIIMSTRDVKGNFRSLKKTEFFKEILSWCNYDKRLPSPEYVEKLHSNIQLLEEKRNRVLVFVNNNPWKQSVGLLQRMYSPYFAKIIFCGSWNEEAFLADELHVHRPVNFISLSNKEFDRENVFYNCVSKVRDLRLPKITGYYFMTEDGIFKFWEPMPFSGTLMSDFIYTKKFSPETHEFGPHSPYAFVKLMDKYYPTLWPGSDKKEQGVRRLLKSPLILKLDGPDPSEFFYVPAKDIDFYADICEKLVDKDTDISLSTQTSLEVYAPENQNSSLNLQNTSFIRIHPVSLSLTTTDLEQREIFCSTVIMEFYQVLFQNGSP